MPSKCRICGGVKPPISRIKGVCNKGACIKQAQSETTKKIKYTRKLKKAIDWTKRKRFLQFGKYQWDLRKNIKGEVYCEETGKFLGDDFNEQLGHGMCISHILPGSSHPELYFHPLNCNVLTHDAHRQWEEGDRKSMKIYNKNQKLIEQMLKSKNKTFDGK